MTGSKTMMLVIGMMCMTISASSQNQKPPLDVPQPFHQYTSTSTSKTSDREYIDEFGICHPFVMKLTTLIPALDSAIKNPKYTSPKVVRKTNVDDGYRF